MHDIRELSLILFKNTYKKADNHPDYKGKVSTKDRKHLYDASAWIKTSKTGSDFLSVRFTDIYKKPENNGSSMPDDDLPF